MRVGSVATVLVAVTVCPASLSAQWHTLPSGEWAYDFDFTSRITVSCQNVERWPRGSRCSVSGTTATITNGAASLEVRVMPAPVQRLTAKNFAQEVTVAHLETRVRGGRFTLPALDTALMGLRITYDEFQAGYRFTTPSALDYNCCRGDRTFTALLLNDLPPGVRYPAIVFDQYRIPRIPLDSASLRVTAFFGFVPEPASVLLLASGLAVLAVARRRLGRGRALGATAPGA
jgi:hypothetical protein